MKIPWTYLFDEDSEINYLLDERFVREEVRLEARLEAMKKDEDVKYEAMR